MIKLSAHNGKLTYSMSPDEKIVSGMVGKEIIVDLSPKWPDMVAVAVCKGSGVTIDQEIHNDRFILPWECVSKSGGRLVIGIYGYTESEGIKTSAVPTIYADLGIIYPGADPSGDPSADASSTLWEQALQDIAVESAERIRVCAELASAINDADGDIAALQETVADEIEARQAGEAAAAHEIENLKTSKASTASLEAESTARQNADNALSGRIDDEVSRSTSAESALAGSIADEVLRARAAESALQTAVDGKAPASHIHAQYATNADLQSEASARYQADAALNTRVTALEQGGGGGGGDVTKAYVDAQDTAERTARESADSALDSRVTELENRPLTSGVKSLSFNGTAQPIDDNGNVNIPYIGGNTYGLAKVWLNYGLLANNGQIYVQNASNAVIDARTKQGNPGFGSINSGNLDYAVKAALCDGKGAAYTEDEQAAARALLGISIWDGGVSE